MPEEKLEKLSEDITNLQTEQKLMGSKLEELNGDSKETLNIVKDIQKEVVSQGKSLVEFHSESKFLSQSFTKFQDGEYKDLKGQVAKNKETLDKSKGAIKLLSWVASIISAAIVGVFTYFKLKLGG